MHHYIIDLHVKYIEFSAYQRGASQRQGGTNATPNKIGVPYVSNVQHVIFYSCVLG